MQVLWFLKWNVHPIGALRKDPVSYLALRAGMQPSKAESILTRLSQHHTLVCVGLNQSSERASLCVSAFLSLPPQDRGAGFEPVSLNCGELPGFWGRAAVHAAASVPLPVVRLLQGVSNYSALPPLLIYPFSNICAPVGFLNRKPDAHFAQLNICVAV